MISAGVTCAEIHRGITMNILMSTKEAKLYWIAPSVVSCLFVVETVESRTDSLRK